MNNKLKENLLILQAMQKVACIGYYVVDIATDSWQSSPVADTIFGIDIHYPRTIAAWLQLVALDYRELLLARYNATIQAAQRFEDVYKIIRFNDEQERWIFTVGEIECDEQGNAVRLYGAVQDVTERKYMADDLRIAAVAFESQEAMVITDANTLILRVNKAFSSSLGYAADEVIGHSIRILQSDLHDTDFYNSMWQCVNETGMWQGEMWGRRKNGEIYPKWSTITAVRASNGLISHYVAIHVDISQHKKAEQEIKQLAFYDLLTQLPNRRLLLERLAYCIESGKKSAVLMLDLDRFKAVNDGLGHAVGDELLQQVAQRLHALLPDVDTVARLGGDEFVILLRDMTNKEQAARLAETVVAELARPFRLCQQHDVHISVSVGISLYPQHGNSPELLINHADAALYQAKQNGRCFAYFSEQLTYLVRERIALERRLHQAIEQQALHLLYQPQVDVHSGEIVGAEVLVRWQDNDCIISPYRFIAIAEESGLIVKIGEWVLQETCQQGRQWLNEGLPPITLAVNVSPHQFRRCDMYELVINTLNKTGFPAELLELEITESSLMEHRNGIIKSIKKLRNAGVRFALDDFGTGYSSLAYLKRFSLDLLKIDRSFINEISTCEKDMRLTEIMIEMGHTLGFKVLAEGVETAEQLAFLRRKNCDLYQGYLKSCPLPAAEFVKLLTAQATF